jgi:hypothetical protein
LRLASRTIARTVPAAFAFQLASAAPVPLAEIFAMSLRD